VSPRPTGLDRVGNLKRPRTQVFVDYTTVRGGLPSPLEGAVAGQILKVDLALMLAQLFDIGFDGRLQARPVIEDVSEDVVARPQAAR
jgi:hypothetical protein